MNICRIDGCAKPASSLGLCRAHYCRQWRYGTTDKVRQSSELTRERIEEHIERIPWSGCWIWLMQIQRSGHGRLRAGGKKVLAHRAAWIAFKGPLADDAFLLHRCNVASCVNPDHLYIGTSKDNTQDCIRAGNFKGYDNLAMSPNRR
jgi:hypothetical protein